MIQIECSPGRCIMGRLPQGSDLLGELTAICARNNITLGEVRAIGAVGKARLGFYDQERKVYEYLDFNEPLELVALVGNVSLKDGQAMVHAHVTLGDHQGRLFGGHLAEGAPVFACEFVIEELKSDRKLERKPDEGTKLLLWG